jgi:hypothetical protein
MASLGRRAPGSGGRARVRRSAAARKAWRARISCALGRKRCSSSERFSMRVSRKPAAVICHGPGTLIDAGVVNGRAMTSWTSSDERGRQVERPGEVVADKGLVSSRKPADLPAFNRQMLEEFAAGRHPRARRPVPRVSNKAGARRIPGPSTECGRTDRGLVAPTPRPKSPLQRGGGLPQGNPPSRGIPCNKPLLLLRPFPQPEDHSLEITAPGCCSFWH